LIHSDLNIAARYAPLIKNMNKLTKTITGESNNAALLVDSSPIQIRKKVGTTIMSLIVASALVGCGGNKKAADPEAVAKQGPDITRPPQTIGTQDNKPVVEERNPDETISFDEWRKKRLEELQGN